MAAVALAKEAGFWILSLCHSIHHHLDPPPRQPQGSRHHLRRCLRYRHDLVRKAGQKSRLEPVHEAHVVNIRPMLRINKAD